MLNNYLFLIFYGGEIGIRTLGTLTRTPVFTTGALNQLDHLSITICYSKSINDFSSLVLVIFIFKLAEKEGFEPSRRLTRPTPLAGAPLQPLEYFSNLKIWRRDRDSNPRYAHTYAGFQDRCLKPTRPSLQLPTRVILSRILLSVNTILKVFLILFFYYVNFPIILYSY